MEINEAGFRFYYDQPIEKGLTCLSNITFISTHQKASAPYPPQTNTRFAKWQGRYMAGSMYSFTFTGENIGDVVISDHTCTDHYIYSFEGRRWRKQPELILSDREKEILQLSVKGLSNTEIGETLFIDANTVKFHKKKIFEKLHAENITEAVGIAANLRLI